jgi:hypothetical protein
MQHVERKEAPGVSGGVTAPSREVERCPPAPGYPQCPGGPIDPPAADPARDRHASVLKI